MASTLIALSLATHVFGFDTIGIGNSASRLNESAATAWNDANSNPNATHSVQFSPYKVGDSTLEFTWTVNVTDIFVPTRQAASRFDDPRAINVVHSFSWPESAGRYLNDTVPGTNSSNPFCISLFYTGFPDNVTDAYTSDNANNTSCAPVLGDACVNALTSSLTYGTAIGGCPSISRWVDLPECAGSGVNSSSIITSNVNSGRNSSHAPNATSSFPLYSGASLAFHQSEIYNGSNVTALEEGENRLQLMVISNGVSQDRTTVWNSQALCMRVSTEANAAMPRAVVATGAVVLAVMTTLFNLM